MSSWLKCSVKAWGFEKKIKKRLSLNHSHTPCLSLFPFSVFLSLLSLSWLSTVSPTHTFLNQILPCVTATSHYLLPALSHLLHPSLTLTLSLLPHLSGIVNLSPLLTHREPELGWEERRDSPSLNISKGSDPQHDPIICPQPLILHFTLSDVLSQGPRWLLFPLSLMGIRDSLQPEVLIAVAVPLNTDFKSTRYEAC